MTRSQQGGDRMHERTIEDFGLEWQTFDQSAADRAEIEQLFSQYFAVFPWNLLPRDAVGCDIGCGSGRWAALVAPRVGRLHCVDASAAALAVARTNLARQSNCDFHVAIAERLPFATGSMDFGYSLGVLHHLRDPKAGMAECVRILKPGAPMLVYLYYRFDDRPIWFRGLWRVADALRRMISELPHQAKLMISAAIATTVYWPLARGARVAERAGISVENFPLMFYRNRSLYTMRTDALDRFGTRVEHRFTMAEIRAMMEDAGLENIVFSSAEPRWCAVGNRPRGGVA